MFATAKKLMTRSSASLVEDALGVILLFALLIAGLSVPIAA